MEAKDKLIDQLLDLAFAEDIGDGDHTTLSTIPADAMGRSKLIIKESGVLAGVEEAEKVLHKVDPSIKITVYLKDGERVNPGDIAFIAEGPVRSLLIAERTMLNIMQRMSGVAT
ncbi:MAG: nicotinate-nucleotide diphosphorylase (carboxylating), partial [Muribaculaceae bacterium]|nr:nicotinate-nucleotide diphosphorylase (carboxylating) [Muribaculaceae bacterium]